jgi:hypothetical protein
MFYDNFKKKHFIFFVYHFLEPFESISIPVILNPVLFQLNHKEDDFISINFFFPRLDIYEENTTFFKENFKSVLDKVACAKKNQIQVINIKRQPAEITVQINQSKKGPKPHIVYSRIRQFVNTDYNFLLYLFAPSNAFKLYNWLDLIQSGKFIHEIFFFHFYKIHHMLNSFLTETYNSYYFV